MSNAEGPKEVIRVVGAREHNLKNVSVEIPRNQLTVITGLSGSGKSTLAFDTIYAEGQRRYVEGLSAYARQFLEQLKKPEVDAIEGLCPAIAIDQKSVSHSPRSTVGTVTEVYDFLRLLYARVGTPHCPDHDVPVQGLSVDQIVQQILQLPPGTKFMVLAPAVQGKKGEFLAEFNKWMSKGFVRAKVDGVYIELDSAKKLAKTRTHDIDIVIDRLVMKADLRPRLSQSVKLALQYGNGRVVVESGDGSRLVLSSEASCPICSFSFPDLEPRLFSFNNPRGACPDCNGLGTLDFEEKIEGEFQSELAREKLARYSIKKQSPSSEEDEEDTDSDLDGVSSCPTCLGTRLKKEARSVKVDGICIHNLSALPLSELRAQLLKMKFSKRDEAVAQKILQQIFYRLEFLERVGVHYLSLDRATQTLSGGESQRIRLASQVGSGLVGVLYVMDEPSIGLHPRDHSRLLEIMKELRDLGNTLIVVEHDEDTILNADHVIDVGPRPGELGGEIVSVGEPQVVIQDQKSITGSYLREIVDSEFPGRERKGSGEFLRLLGATGNNLKSVDLEIPLGRLVAVTGVSGSGKSTLILDTLYRVLAKKLHKSPLEPKPYGRLEGAEHIDRIVQISQKPIGRTPRSNPATYTGLFPLIRDLYAQTPEAKMRGYRPGRFSFNVKGGRCENCQGAGVVKMEMHFMSDVYVTCEVCQGKRYNRETLAVRYRDKSIADVLNMPVGEAVEFFRNHPLIFKRLETLHRTGLDYIRLGQSSTTLSGGEAQRIKLSRELAKRATGRTLYILDEPTTGLHFQDVDKLVDVLQDLADQGNTVVVIEHNLDLVAASDFVIDLGPEAGPDGGEITGQGEPRTFALKGRGPTAVYLKKHMESRGWLKGSDR